MTRPLSTRRGSETLERITTLRDDLAWVEEALGTLQEIANETLPDDASPQLAYIVEMARLAVKELP